MSPICRLHLRANGRWTYGIADRAEEGLSVSIFTRCEVYVYDNDYSDQSQKINRKKAHVRFISSDATRTQINKTKIDRGISDAKGYITVSAEADPESFVSDGETILIDPVEIWLSISSYEVDSIRQLLLSISNDRYVDITFGVLVEDSPQSYFVSAGLLVRDQKKSFPIISYECVLIHHPKDDQEEPDI